MKSLLKLRSVCSACTFPSLKLISYILGLFILLGSTQISAQEIQYTRPSWWFGLAGGANFNFYRGSTQTLNSDLRVPVVFHDGNSVGLFLAPAIEYHPFGSNWGFQLHVGFDGRSGSFEQEITPCNCPADLSTNLSYLTVEPSIKFAPFGSNFYLFGGPRLAFNLQKEFTYEVGVNPDFPDRTPPPDVTEDFSDVKSTLISFQIGAGYDIPLNSTYHQTQYILSPFVSFQPYFGQSPRSVETWNLTTLRVGAALMFGRGTKIEPIVSDIPENTVEPMAIPEVGFSVVAPKEILAERNVTEMFPIRNYVFFDQGSTEIPNRYVLLSKDQAGSFQEDQMKLNTAKTSSTRSERQLEVYYNLLNILGNRLQTNSTATITLVGSSEKGSAEGKAMAESVKKYLVDVFGINSTRINIEGRDKPLIQTGPAVEESDKPLLMAGDRRVSIENRTPSELMNIKSNQDLLLKPVGFVSAQKNPVDSYVSFHADGAKQAFSVWTLEIVDDRGEIRRYGPFYQDSVSIPGRTLLNSRTKGDYKVKMIGHTADNQTVEKQTDMQLKLLTPPVLGEGLRYSVIFEFDEAVLDNLYVKYLNETVIPNIPDGSTVIVHGYTDIIGKESHNQELSQSRASNVRKVLESGLNKAGKTNIKYEEFGFGEDPKLAPFDNRYPEENYYNRTTIIDVIPNKQ
jgi:outer membrane protein OmpA-like peptidoglycan-associated protein